MLFLGLLLLTTQFHMTFFHASSEVCSRLQNNRSDCLMIQV